MKKSFKNILIITACILLLALMALVLFFSGHTTMNPSGTVGNTAGNLNNDGLFCEYDGTVYFSNATVGGCLYAMNPDETDIRCLNDLKVRNILAGGKYLYFFQTGAASISGFGHIEGIKSFDRCKLNGNDITAITRDVVVTGQLVDNYLYLLTAANPGASFYKVKIDKSETVQLADYNINPACARNGVIYYSGTQENHYLYTLNTANDVSSELWRGNLCYPVLDGDYIYYMDVAENYRLCRYSLSRNEIEILTNDRVDCFNVGNGYIYYQKSGKNPQLKFMRLDGSENTVLAEGNFTHINMTSRYVYFQQFGNDTTMYHAPFGSTGYSTFVPIDSPLYSSIWSNPWLNIVTIWSSARE